MKIHQILLYVGILAVTVFVHCVSKGYYNSQLDTQIYQPFSQDPGHH